jgi:serine/threonine protein kinase
VVGEFEPEHPHVITCHFVRTVGSEMSMVTEYAPDGSLAEQIKSGSLYQRTPDDVLGRILEIAVQTADGLALARDLRLLHLDIKPGNIVFAGKNAKITDFGLATTSQSVQYRQAEGGNFTPVDQGSPGQKTAALLTVILQWAPIRSCWTSRRMISRTS